MLEKSIVIGIEEDLKNIGYLSSLETIANERIERESLGVEKTKQAEKNIGHNLQ